jgi:mono/diheme cytochrome c family protein
MRAGAALISQAAVIWTGVTLAVSGVSAAAGISPQTVNAAAGMPLYESACAACHGTDGRGAPPATVGFDTPLPDFTDCGFATPEPDADWLAVIHEGGPVRAFDRRMPAFGEALSGTELQQIVDHLRTFCHSRAWPRGELNLPRAFITEKAFPENEAVVTTTISADPDRAIGNEFLFERRLGARSQFEVVVPILLAENGSAGWQRGLGDVALAFKHAIFHSIDHGSILSVAGELTLPTGKETAGLGSGVTVFEPFVAFGQVLPRDSFVQAQAGVELPSDTARAEKEVFWRTAVGKTITQGRFGRAWSPMLELLATRDLEEHATARWDLLPQMQVTLSRRQHIMINAGVRLPLNDREGRRPQVLTYFLWDWADGGLTDGWR